MASESMTSRSIDFAVLPFLAPEIPCKEPLVVLLVLVVCDRVCVHGVEASALGVGLQLGQTDPTPRGRRGIGQALPCNARRWSLVFENPELPPVWVGPPPLLARGLAATANSCFYPLSIPQITGRLYAGDTAAAAAAAGKGPEARGRGRPVAGRGRPADGGKPCPWA